MRAETVYRAPGGLLPREFWVEDDASGTIGGVEFAFMSATTERAVALDYARRGKAGVLLEIRQGLTARGASLQWLSQCDALRWQPPPALAWHASRPSMACPPPWNGIP
eukprot:5804092-Prymnesium_polylepis.1